MAVFNKNLLAKIVLAALAMDGVGAMLLNKQLEHRETELNQVDQKNRDTMMLKNDDFSTRMSKDLGDNNGERIQITEKEQLQEYLATLPSRVRNRDDNKNWVKGLYKIKRTGVSLSDPTWRQPDFWSATDHIVAPFQCVLVNQFTSTHGAQNEDGVTVYTVNNLAGFSEKGSKLQIQETFVSTLDQTPAHYDELLDQWHEAGIMTQPYIRNGQESGFTKEDVFNTPVHFDNEVKQGAETFRYKYWAELAKQINDKVTTDPLLSKKNLAPKSEWCPKAKDHIIAKDATEQFEAQNEARTQLIKAYKALEWDKYSLFKENRDGTNVEVINRRQQKLQQWYNAWLNFVNTFDNDLRSLVDKNGKTVVIHRYNEYVSPTDPYKYQEIDNRVAMRNYVWKHFEKAVARVRKIRNAVLTKHMEFKAAKKIVLAEADEEEKNCRFLAHIHGEKSKYFKMKTM